MEKWIARFVSLLLICTPIFAEGQQEEGTTETMEPQTIRIGLAMPQGSEAARSVNGMYELFKQEVEANSNGLLSVEIVYGGVLGQPDERLNQMRRGFIQMSDAADGNYSSIYPDIQVFNMPYLFPTEQVAWEVLDGPIGDQIADGIREETGIRVLGWWESGGFKHYSANRPIESPDDMTGMKMRVMGPVFSLPVTAMGGSATPIAFNELYTALQTGVVDGQDNAVWVFNAAQLHEVQDYLMLDGHIYAFGPLGINDQFFSALPSELQTVVLDAADEAIAFNRRVSREQESSEIAFAQENGVEVITFDASQKAAFAEIVRPYAVEWFEENLDTPSLVQEVLAAVESASN